MLARAASTGAYAICAAAPLAAMVEIAIGHKTEWRRGVERLQLSSYGGVGGVVVSPVGGDTIKR